MNAADVLARKYGDLFDFTNIAINEGPTFLAGRNANSVARKVTLFHLVRAGYLLEATYTLCSHGLATEANGHTQESLKPLHQLEMAHVSGS